MPWDDVDGISYLENTIEFPNITRFHSSLNDSDITEAEWADCKKFFKKFKCKNMAEYLKLYCWTGKELNIRYLYVYKIIYFFSYYRCFDTR